MNLLALDIGLRKTGVAFGETKSGILMALDTLRHESNDELTEKVSKIVRNKKIDQLIVGLPLLPSGEEGTQSTLVREAAKTIEATTGLHAEFLDERYTTKAAFTAKGSDPDAIAACALLTVKMDRKNAIDTSV